MRFILGPLFILIIGFKTLNAQDFLFAVQLTGGVNYSINSYGGVLTFPEINRKQPGLNSGLTVKYFLDQNNILLLGLEYIESKITGKNKYLNAEWIFQGYPILVGYQYNFHHNSDFLGPYISINMGYYLSKVKFYAADIPDDFLDDTHNYTRFEGGLEINGNLGLSWKILEKIAFLSELKLRYNDASIFSRQFSIEFTGIYLNAGINYKF
jgi:hypothetical protein